MAKIHAKMSAKAKKRRKRRCNRQKRLKPTRLSYVHSCASRRAQTFCKWLNIKGSIRISYAASHVIEHKVNAGGTHGPSGISGLAV